MGHVLRYRLYLWRVQKGEISSNEVSRNPEETILYFRDIELPLADINRLIASEIAEARHVLRRELLFGFKAPTLRPQDMWEVLEEETWASGSAWRMPRGENCEGQRTFCSHASTRAQVSESST
ncbi:hypothetical protein K470DRAFT_272103 [Piedraia hortae CBS 480.64]|uniref:Uncharacterized protein n=1 Tax=Piedraia hortae CBS 480.64 TaxID=1314780 RepID=A0A6A7BVT4_9PEZI|nr:hypothetical protein K470DRAFT_272103 [Piedraia hortae CBS 480.64]